MSPRAPVFGVSSRPPKYLPFLFLGTATISCIPYFGLFRTTIPIITGSALKDSFEGRYRVQIPPPTPRELGWPHSSEPLFSRRQPNVRRRIAVRFHTPILDSPRKRTRQRSQDKQWRLTQGRVNKPSARVYACIDCLQANNHRFLCVATLSCRLT